jgi:hypothetical protein
MTEATEFDFAAGALVRKQQANFEAAKAELKTVQKAFLATGAVETFAALLKEATGGKAKSYLYVLIAAGDEEYCAYIKGNEKIGNNGSLNVTYGYQDYSEAVNLAQLLKIYGTDEEGKEYVAQWNKEEKAYQDWEAEEARLAQEEIDRKAREKEELKQQREAEKALKKNGGVPPTSPEAGDTKAPVGATGGKTDSAAPAAPAGDKLTSELADALKPINEALDAKAPADKAPAGKPASTNPAVVGVQVAKKDDAKAPTEARTAPRGPGAPAVPAATTATAE